MRFLSHDPHARYNPEATPYRIDPAAAPPTARWETPPEPYRVAERLPLNNATAMSLTGHLRRAGVSLENTKALLSNMPRQSNSLKTPADVNALVDKWERLYGPFARPVVSDTPQQIVSPQATQLALEAVFNSPFLATRIEWLGSTTYATTALMLVGHSGSGKSVLQRGLTMIASTVDRLEAIAYNQAVDDFISSFGDKKPSQTQIRASVPEPMITSDGGATEAAMVDSLARYKTMLMVDNEADGLIASMGADYNAKKSSVLRKFLENEEVKYNTLLAKRHTRGGNYLFAALLACTPGVAERFVNGEGRLNGLAARFTYLHLPMPTTGYDRINLSPGDLSRITTARAEPRTYSPDMAQAQDHIERIWASYDKDNDIYGFIVRAVRDAYRRAAVNAHVRKLDAIHPDHLEAHLHIAELSLAYVASIEDLATDRNGNNLLERKLRALAGDVQLRHGVAAPTAAINKIRQMAQAGVSVSAIARALRVSRTTIQKYLKD
jgi:hypothetical protein